MNPLSALQSDIDEFKTPKLLKSIFGMLIIILLFTSQTFSQNCQNTSTGFSPINDLRINYWRGYQGGLYPNGSNYKPTDHGNAGMVLASQHVKPLDTNGNYDPVNGKIVLLSIGMSNTSQEFTRFMQIANTSGILNPKLQIVNGAQGGQHINIIIDSTAQFWTNVETRLRQNGVSVNQVQVIWFKQAEANVTDTTFPGYANSLKAKLKTALNIIQNKYSNVKLCYVSSRIYAGYATTNLNPEPIAYYSGWSVKWLIEDQINGDTLINYWGNNPKSPWLAWGPYIWADGLVPRLDGLIWRCPIDYANDGVHPSDSGRNKVGNMLFNFFSTDSTSRVWFLDNSLNISNGEIILTNYSLSQNYPNPFNPSTIINYVIPVSGFVNLTVYDIRGNEVSKLVNKGHNAGSYSVEFKGSNLPSGVYFYKLRVAEFVNVKRMILLK